MEVDASFSPTEPLAATEDMFLGGTVKLKQPAAGYRAGIDAVLLAAATPLRQGRGARVIDIGSGVGAVGLCIAARVPEARVTLLEAVPKLAAMARENIASNKLACRVDIVVMEIGASPAAKCPAGLRPDSYDHSVANPPFNVEGRGRLARDPLKAGAHAMPMGGLEVWLRFMARMTKGGGTATLIHRADALGELLNGLEGRFGALRIRPIHAHRSKPALRVLVQGIKGSRAPSTLLPGLVLHGDDGRFTPEIEAVLRAPGAVNFSG